MDDKVYIIDSPLEALSLKLLHPDSTILATGGYMPAAKLQPYLDRKEVFLTQGQDKIGREMFRYLAEHFSKAKRIQPAQGKNWNECRLLQIEEEEKARAKVAVKAQSNTLAPTASINRSTGWSR